MREIGTSTHTPAMGSDRNQVSLTHLPGTRHCHGVNMSFVTTRACCIMILSSRSLSNSCDFWHLLSYIPLTDGNVSRCSISVIPFPNQNNLTCSWHRHHRISHLVVLGTYFPLSHQNNLFMVTPANSSFQHPWGFSLPWNKMRGWEDSSVSKELAGPELESLAPTQKARCAGVCL